SVLVSFFFSSRRRHTRFSRDWSSDVCSSDLLEMRVRHRNEHYSASLARLIPPVATRLDQGGEQAVAVKSLLPGDLIRVASGATIPCDGVVEAGQGAVIDRKSTRLNSSHVKISYAVFCLKKK